MNGNQPFPLTGRQQLVYSSLETRNPEIASLYKTGVRIRADCATTGELYLAGFVVRTMINDLPEAFSLPTLSSLPLLSSKIADIETIWTKATDSKCRADGAWSGEIDTPLQKLLEALEGFFSWRKKQNPTKRQITADMFRRTDPSLLELPRDLRERPASRWLKLFGYFNKVTHRSTTSFEEFDENLRELEQIMLDNLYRQPSADLATIDAILAEETPDA